MKKYYLAFIACTVLFLAGLSNVSAQQAIKIAHINTQELLEAMPESDSAKQQLEKDAQDLEKQMELMEVEYRRKLDQFMKEQESYSDIILETKQTEIQELQQRIQNFQVTAQQRLQRKQTTLFKPILDKANEAIEKVAKEKGFTYVIDSSTGVLVFAADNAVDLLPEVKKSLGLE